MRANLTRTTLLALALALLMATGPAWSQTIRYYHTDLTGSVVAVTDEQGNVVERRQYEPYGLPQSPIPDGPGYTGHDMDGESGLVYMQQRYYDPEVGRFLSVDPVGVDGANGTNFNRYWYANDNPHKYVDPDGQFGLIGFVIGAGLDIGAQMLVEGKSLSEVNLKEAAVAGAVGMVTGGIGATLARSAAQGVITSSTAIVRTAAVGGGASAAGEIAASLLDGQAPDPADVLIAGAVGAAGSAIGARIGNAATVELESMRRAGGMAAHIANTTQPTLAGAGAELTVSGVQRAATIVVDGASSVAQKNLETDRDRR